MASKSDNSKSPKNTEKAPKIAEIKITEKHRQWLIDDAKRHTEQVNALRPKYPSPSEQLSLAQLKLAGFTDADHVMILSEDEDEGTDDAGVDAYKGRRRRRKNPKGKGGRQTSNQSSGGGKRLPDPAVIAAEVENALKNVALAGSTGDISIGEQNWENLEETKANFFATAIKSIITRHHINFAIEVSPKGLQVMANNNPDYTAYCSSANNRQQAVGFLIHKRLKVLKATSYSNVANVFGIPDLRPAYRLDLQDTVTGIKLSAVVVHLKSMRGGEPKTSPVRKKQAQELVKSLGNGNIASLPAYGELEVYPWFKNSKLKRDLTDHALLRITLRLDAVACTTEGLILIGGDWNSKLDTAHDLDDLYTAGWLLAYKQDDTGTQIMGPSRLDGFVGNGNNDQSCGGGNGGNPNGPFSNDPTDDPERAVV